MNPVIHIGIESLGGPWNCHCDSEGWYTRGCRFINFHINGNKLYYDIIFPNGKVEENKSHIIDCISRDYHNKTNLTLKFEDGTEKVFNVKDRNERTDLVEFLKEYNKNGYEIKVDHSYELAEEFDDI
ncbi:MAG: hypothetical protein J5767_12905 [Paludibacteraceae bacterium]|nr:hypothetical protein [Paludibacteraceae bacterium]